MSLRRAKQAADAGQPLVVGHSEAGQETRGVSWARQTAAGDKRTHLRVVGPCDGDFSVNRRLAVTIFASARSCRLRARRRHRRGWCVDLSSGGCDLHDLGELILGTVGR